MEVLLSFISLRGKTTENEDRTVKVLLNICDILLHAHTFFLQNVVGYKPGDSPICCCSSFLHCMYFFTKSPYKTTYSYIYIYKFTYDILYIDS